MAFMKFYVGDVADAGSHRDGLYIATDTHQIFYGGYNLGGEDIDLSGYMTLGTTQTVSGKKTFSQAITAPGFAISGGSSASLLNAAGGTTKVSDLVTQVTASIVDGAPTTLDTLNELSAALGDDPNFATTITNQIAGKADASHTHEISDITNLQSTLNGKAASSHTHPVSQVTGLTASRALVSDSSGHPAVSSVTSTELGYLDGVTSNVQTQLNGKADSSHTHTVANISNLGSNWATALTAAKPNWLTSVSLSTISNLNSGWDSLLAAAPSSYVTRWPSISEVTGKTNLVVKLNGGTTEGTNQFTYNGVTAKTVNITASSIGAAARSHTHTASQVSGLSTVATSGSYNDLTNKPTIPSAYTLPTASSSTKGGVKIGTGLRMSGEVLSVNFSGYATQSWANDQFLPLSGGTLTGTLYINPGKSSVLQSTWGQQIINIEHGSGFSVMDGVNGMSYLQPGNLAVVNPDSDQGILISIKGITSISNQGSNKVFATNGTILDLSQDYVDKDSLEFIRDLGTSSTDNSTHIYRSSYGFTAPSLMVTSQSGSTKHFKMGNLDNNHGYINIYSSTYVNLEYNGLNYRLDLAKLIELGALVRLDINDPDL